MLLLFWAVGAKLWVGRDTDGRGFFYDLKVPEKLAEQKHEIEYKFDIVHALGGRVSDVRLEVCCDKGDDGFVEDILGARGVRRDDVLVGINCSTFRPSRNWTAERYADLADRLHDRLNARVCFTGVAGDKSLFEEIKGLAGCNITDLMGVFTTRQLACFFKRCRLLISPDCGAAHIAAAVRAPLVVLFGPGEYARYRPYGNDNKTIVIRKEVDCSPCLRDVCRHKKCMMLITPAEVFDAARRLLKQ